VLFWAEKLGGKEVGVGSIEFQITSWGPKKKVQRLVTWFVR